MGNSPTTTTSPQPVALWEYSDVENRLGVKRRRIERWVAEGKLKAVKFNQRIVRFRPADVDEFIASNVTGGEAANA